MKSVILVMLLLTPAAPPADTPASLNPEAEEVTDFVLAGIKHARDKLRSGVFRAWGHLDESARPEYPLEGDIEIFCAFDFDNGFLRFDRLEPMWWAPAASSGAKGASDAAKVVQDGGKFVALPDRCVQWRTREKMVWIRRAQEKPTSITRPFDIRVLGLTNWAGLDFGVSWQDALRYIQAPPHDALAETKVYRLVRVDQENGSRFDFFLDGEKGFSPVRLEQRERPPNSTGDWGEPSEVDEVTWAQKNGLWVPTSFYQEVRRPVRKRRELRIQWESVNEPVDEALFTWEGLGLPKGTLVVDERLGKPIKVAVVGVRDFPNSSNVGGGLWAWLRWFMVALTVGIIVLGAWFGLRNRFRRPPS
jgi:hypothetical protein